MLEVRLLGYNRNSQNNEDRYPVLILIMLEVRLLVRFDKWNASVEYSCLNPYYAGSETVGRYQKRY